MAILAVDVSETGLPLYLQILPTKEAKGLNTLDEIATIGFPGAFEQAVSTLYRWENQMLRVGGGAGEQRRHRRGDEAGRQRREGGDAALPLLRLLRRRGELGETVSGALAWPSLLI